ncbi:MAG: FAD-dependent oxidoreductase [Bacteroidota bacterium]|nr:FAD-dependent oxidoreductase [Bacteroidota bacterium]
MKNYDAIIIGAGQAGKPLATFLSEKGYRVAVIEKAFAGGSCINYGCTPTKIMIASARAAFDARQAKRLGVDVAEVRVNFKKIIKRRDEIVRSWRQGITDSFQEDENIDFIQGKASFEDKNKVKVEIQNAEPLFIASDKIFLNTGTLPRIPEIERIDQVPYLNALNMMELNEKMARKQNTPYKLAAMEMKNVSRGIETANTKGLMKVLTDADTDRILGASMLMPEGGEIMAILQVAMMGKLTYQDLMDSPFAHPTYAESLNNLFMNLK